MGLDLGDQYSYYYTLDAAGENVESGRVKTSREGVEKRFEGQEAARVVSDQDGRIGEVERARPAPFCHLTCIFG